MKKQAPIRPAVQSRLVVECATWLSETNLLLIGRLPGPIAAATARKQDLGAGQPRFMVVPSRRGEVSPRTTRVLVHWPLHEDAWSSGSTTGAPTATLFPFSAVKRRTGTVQEFAREGLAWLDPKARAEVLDFIIRSASARAVGASREAPVSSPFAPNPDVRLSASLHALREALRERLPIGLTRGGPMALIDAVAKLDRDAFFMRGRVRAGASRPIRVTAVSPEGGRIEILERANWYDLPASQDQQGDGAWKGFAAFFTCAPSARQDGWIVELETRSGELLEVEAPAVTSRAAEVIRVILEDMSIDRLPATQLRTGQVMPAIKRLQQARLREAGVEKVRQFGAVPDSPAVTVIVPLYRRIDLIEHQLAQFADDPGMRSTELIYVLDSPELEDELFDTVRRLYPLYRQPFRVAVLSANVGFAGANNLGASIARGRILLLLNSDVFPEAPGWLEAMTRFYESLPNAGAVGPKLLYEDDTLQHAGMYFERLNETRPWSNEHYYKGMHRDLPAAAKSRPVPAVTGACMMIAKDLYLDVGGLSGEYVQGDFEDSDLCLRVLDAGRQNWYFADVALYHLEASSYDPDRRRLHDGFNRWLHTHIWAERLGMLGGPQVMHVASPSPRTVAHAEPANGAVMTGAIPGS